MPPLPKNQLIFMFVRK